MKKNIFAAILLLASYFSYGQRLKQGTLFGVHTITVKLKQNVKMEEFTSFFKTKVIPEYEKNWIGLKGYMLQSFSDTNSFAIVWQFESVKARNRYFTKDNKPNDLERANWVKVKPVDEELKKFGDYTINYKETDDWVIL